MAEVTFLGSLEPCDGIRMPSVVGLTGPLPSTVEVDTVIQCKQLVFNFLRDLNKLGPLTDLG